MTDLKLEECWKSLMMTKDIEDIFPFYQELTGGANGAASPPGEAVKITRTQKSNLTLSLNKLIELFS